MVASQVPPKARIEWNGMYRAASRLPPDSRSTARSRRGWAVCPRAKATRLQQQQHRGDEAARGHEAAPQALQRGALPLKCWRTPSSGTPSPLAVARRPPGPRAPHRGLARPLRCGSYGGALARQIGASCNSAGRLASGDARRLTPAGAGRSARSGPWPAARRQRAVCACGGGRDCISSRRFLRQIQMAMKTTAKTSRIFHESATRENDFEHEARADVGQQQQRRAGVEHARAVRPRQPKRARPTSSTREGEPGQDREDGLVVPLPAPRPPP